MVGLNYFNIDFSEIKSFLVENESNSNSHNLENNSPSKPTTANTSINNLAVSNNSDDKNGVNLFDENKREEKIKFPTQNMV